MNLEDSMSVARDRARKTAKSKSSKNRRSTKKAAKRAKTASAASPVKVTVKQAVLDVFYADQRKVLSTKDAVAAIQTSHPGMNESSIRVWISDFRKDGSIKLVKKDGREAFLKAGKLGKFALR